MSDDENIGGNNGFDQLGAGLGQMFSGLFGGMAQGLGNAAQGLGGQNANGEAAANPFANLLGGAGANANGEAAANPFANLFGGAGAGGEGGENPLGDLFTDALKAQLSGQEVDEEAMKEKLIGKIMKNGFAATDPFLEKIFAGEKPEIKKEFSPEETLSPDKFDQEQVEYYGCYSNNSWDYNKIPASIQKVDFHGDGYFNDNFVQLLLKNPRLSFKEVQMVDLRGCNNLTDIGLIWLSRLLKDCVNLHTILLVGCFHLTKRGVAPLWDIPSDPLVDALGTGLVVLPEPSSSEETQQEHDEKDTKVVPMSKLSVHQEDDAAFSLTTLLTAKTKEPAGRIKYHHSWSTGGTDYSLVETALSHSANRLLRPEDATQVLVSVDLDGAQDKSLRYIADVVDYHMVNADAVVEYTKPLYDVIYPARLVNSLWDYATGRLLFFLGIQQIGAMVQKLQQMGEDQNFDEDDMDALCHSMLNVALDKAHPCIEMMVECSPETTMKLALSLAAIDFEQSVETELAVRNGDIIRFGIKDAEEMENHLLLDDGDHEFYVSVNDKRDGSVVSFISYDRGDTQNFHGKLGDHLTELGSTFWMDEDSDPEKTEMSADAIAALSSCKLVLCCVTKEYFKSAIGKKELETATSLKKQVILIELQELDATSKSRVATLTELDHVTLVTKDETDDLDEIVKKHSKTYYKKVSAKKEKAKKVSAKKEKRKKVSAKKEKRKKVSAKKEKRENLSDDFSGGSFFLGLSSKAAGAVRFLNHRPITSSESSHPIRDFIVGGTDGATIDYKDSPIIDMSSGVLRAGQKTQTLKSVNPISAANAEFSFRLKWTEAGPKRVVWGLSSNFELDSDDIDDEDVETNGHVSNLLTLEESGEDVIRLAVENVGAFVQAVKKYPVKFYKNDELVKESTFQWDLESMEDGSCLPYFFINIEKQTELHILDYAPPPWFSAQMEVATMMTETRFLFPKHVESHIILKDTSIRFPNINGSYESVHMATSLTEHHPSFEVVVSMADPEHVLHLVAQHYDIHVDSSTNPNSYKAVDLKVGDVIRCSMKTAGHGFDSFGIPLPEQTVTLIYTKNGEEVKKVEMEYLGGGLHPVLAGSRVELTMKNMNIKEYHDITGRTAHPQKQFVVVGTSQKTSTGDSQEQLLSLQKATFEHLAQHQQELKVVVDDARANISPSFAGDLIRTRLDVQSENWAQVVKAPSSMFTFTALNTDTMQGYDDLCSIIQTNQSKTMKEQLELFDYTILRKSFAAILDKSHNPKILVADECEKRWGVGMNMVVPLLRMLHQWGKVLFLEEVSPWVVILDVDWFVDIIRVLETSKPEKTTAGHVPSLHPATRAWEDKQLAVLAKDKTLNEKKALLSVLLKYHQLIRLTGPRANRKDVRSFLVAPHNLRQPEVPLSQFYDPETFEDDMLTVRLTFRSPGSVPLGVQRAVLCEAAQLSPPVLLAPSHLVTQLGAAQVVLVWQEPEGEGVAAELVLVVKAFLPAEETASKDIVTEYCFTIAHLYEDLVSNVLLTNKTPFVPSCQPQGHSANLSVCSSHRWSCEEGDRQVSVCTLCANCSAAGMRCPYNQVKGPYSVHRCECHPHVVCCQDCGLCQHCAQTLWAIRSKLRPCLDVQKQMRSRQVLSSTMSYTKVIMTPAIFNEATVVRTGDSDAVSEINIGLICEDGKRFVQLFPGKAVVGTKDQEYHPMTRKVITDRHVATDPNLQLGLGDRITLLLSEPAERSLEHAAVKNTGNKEAFYVNLMYRENCSISRATNTLRCRGRKGLGMAISHLPTSNKALYFDAEIVSLSSEEFTGIGMTPSVNVAECIAHGTGHNMLTGCQAWAKQRWAVGHVVGCGTWLQDGQQVVGFTHNDQVVCKHVLPEVVKLHAVVLVRPGQALRLLRGDIWGDPKELQVETESRMPLNQEVFESDDCTVRISPKETLLFEQGIGDNQLPTSTIHIENNGDLYVLFKVRTTQQSGYISNPNRGVIRPHEVVKIHNECKADDSDISTHRFQIAWIHLEDYEVSDDDFTLDQVTALWSLKSSQRAKEEHHKVNCGWTTGQDHVRHEETNFAEELDEADSVLTEPSYRVRVLKNGDEVGSYWLPKGGYKLAIEAQGEKDAPSVLQDVIMLHLPKLPVEDVRDTFRVGMRVNVAMEADELKDYMKAIKSVCENPRGVYAVCQVDKVERDDEGTPKSLRLSFHGTPSATAPGKLLTLTLPIDSTRLEPVGRDVKAVSEDVSVSVNEEGVVQLVGLTPDTCRTAPRHLFKKTGSKKDSYYGTKCENLLFGAHMVQQLKDQLNPKAVLVSPTFVVLPSQLTTNALRHPPLRALHDFSALRVHPVCQVMVNPNSEDWHLVDSEGFTTEGHLDYTVLYRNRQIMYNYLDLAAKKLKLPSYAQIVQVDKSMPRHQVEALLHSILRTYASTAVLLAIPRYMKVAYVDLPEYRDWEPRSFLPLDFEPDSLCTLHPPTGGLVLGTGPQVEHARHLAVVPAGQALPATAAADCFPVEPADLEKALSHAPSTETLTLEGPWEETGKKVRLALPALSRVTNTSDCQVYVDACPRLTSWEGSIVDDVDEQLKLLFKCDKLERLVVHANRIERLPETIGALRQLTTLHLTESHLAALPEAFASLKNLRDLSIAGPTAQWDKRNSLHISMDEIKRKFPLVEEKKIHEVMKTLSPNWNGSQTVTTNAQQRGKVLYAFYQLNASFGHKKDAGVHGGFPRQILQLTALRHLRLSHQAIRAVPPQISRLENLETLELDGCMDLEVLPSTLGFLPLKKLSLQDCISLRTPSREIVERGTESVTAYLKHMARGKSQNWRTKLMLVGIGGAGKTTLLRALRSNSHVAKATTEEQITHGIDIETWTARDDKKHPGVEVVFSAWDFAGQTVFYNTHQFFMSDRAVYLLVWSCRQGYDNSGLDFWLSSIQCHSPDAPVFVIATHADRLTTDLPQGQLKETYPQIKGFHFVGSTTGKGIASLKASILDAAVDLDYMGEDVPTVYLDLEQQLLSLRDEENPYIKWSEVKKYAMEAGIFDDKGVARAVQFLQQIGSVQYFDYALLRDYVVINPQWIVGAMASVVTFKDSVIKNGRLYHKHTAQLWKKYPKKLHEWLLRLTEMFDLTFQISKELSLVPCLLSNERPTEAKWPPKDNIDDESVMLIIYAFRYLPTGLFNRLQARLFEFSKGKTVWKKGSILEKKGHFAYLMHERDQRLMVQVLGSHPENFLFLIHETLEDLIHRSYRGIQFEYQIPCPDCVREVGWDNPAMFEASLVREAAKCAAPYLQCRRLFHTVPMNNAKALMPPDDNQELDLQLQRSMQSLGEMRSSLKTDIFVLFTPADLVPEESWATKVDPRMVVNRLKEDFTCFFDEKIDEADTQVLMVSMQEAKTLLVFISNQFVEDARCSQLLQYAYPIFKDRFFLVNLSPDYGWKSHTAGFILSQKIFVNMKKFAEDTFKAQFGDLKSSITDKLGLASKAEEKTNDPACFLSYGWNNSKKANALRKITKDVATACDPREIKDRIEKELGTRCWLDVEQTGKRGLFEDITEGLRAADMVVVFASNEYVSSANCMMELRFAVSTLRIPIIIIAVGKGMEWQYEELGTLQRNAKAQVIDMQKEVTDADMQELYAFITSKTLSPEQREEKRQKMKAKTSKMSMVEIANISYQEEFELAQRKLMRRLTYLASHQSTIPYPRLFTLDFTDSEAPKTPDPKTRPDSGRKTISRRKSTLRRRDSVLIKQGLVPEEDKLSLDEPLCIRYLCEHDQGWHATSEVLELHGLTAAQKEKLLEQMAPYLARMMTLLKHSSVPLRCLSGDNGAAFKQYLVKLAIEAQTADSLEKAYVQLLQFVIEQDKDVTRGSLKKCVLSGGRIRWLCPEHQKGYRVTVLTTDVAERASDQGMDTEYHKGVMDGLRRSRGTSGTERPEINVVDMLANASLEAIVPRIASHAMNCPCSRFSDMFKGTEYEDTFNTVKATIKTEFEKAGFKKEFEKASKFMGTIPEGSVSPPVPAPRRPQSGRSTKSAGEKAPPKKKVMLKESGRRVSVEQREAAERMMRDMGQQQQNPTSQACVIL